MSGPSPKVLFFNVVTAGQFTVNPKQDFFDAEVVDISTIKEERELDLPKKAADATILKISSKLAQKQKELKQKQGDALSKLQKEISELKNKLITAQQDTGHKRKAYFDTQIPGSEKSLAELWRKEFLDTKEILHRLIIDNFRQQHWRAKSTQCPPNFLVLCFDGDPPGSPPAVLVHYLFTIFSDKKIYRNLKEVHILQCQSKGDYDRGVFMDGNYPCNVSDFNKQESPSEMPNLYGWLNMSPESTIKPLITKNLEQILHGQFHTLKFKGWSDAYINYGQKIPDDGPDCTNLGEDKINNKFEFDVSLGILITNMGDRVLPQDVDTFKGKKGDHYKRCVGGNLGVWNYFFQNLKLSPTDRSPDFETFLSTNISKLQHIIDIREFDSHLLISNVLPIIKLLNKKDKYLNSITSQTLKWATAAQTEHLKLKLTPDSLTDDQLNAAAALKATGQSAGSRLRKRTRSRRRFNKRVSKSRRSIKRRQRRSKKRRMKKLKSRR